MILIYLHVFVCCGIILKELLGRNYPFSYPLILAAAQLYFLTPGFFALSTSGFFDAYEVGWAASYGSLASIAAYVGWQYPSEAIMARIRPGRVERDRAKIWATGAIVFGSFFTLMIQTVDKTLLEHSQWSGPQTIYYFLATPLWLAMPVCAVLFVRTRKITFLLLLAIPLLMVVPGKFASGRRDEIVEVGLLAILCLRIAFGYMPSRLVFMAGGAFLAVLFSNIGSYRGTSKESGAIEATKSVINDFIGKNKVIRKVEWDYPEAVNYITTFNYRMDNFNVNLGVYYWNRLVFNYVPGQIVGFGTKEAMQFDLEKSLEVALGKRNIEQVPGATNTGLMDTFDAFSWAGVLLFGFTGSFLSALFKGMLRGSESATFCYCYLLVMGAVGFTHEMTYMLTGVINVFIFQYVWQRTSKVKKLPHSVSLRLSGQS